MLKQRGLYLFLFLNGINTFNNIFSKLSPSKQDIWTESIRFRRSEVMSEHTEISMNLVSDSYI
jgi:hypothetical protein